MSQEENPTVKELGLCHFCFLEIEIDSGGCLYNHTINDEATLECPGSGRKAKLKIIDIILGSTKFSCVSPID